jgi:hypothetical protein
MSRYVTVPGQTSATTTTSATVVRSDNANFYDSNFTINMNMITSPRDSSIHGAYTTDLMMHRSLIYHMMLSSPRRQSRIRRPQFTLRAYPHDPRGTSNVPPYPLNPPHPIPFHRTKTGLIIIFSIVSIVVVAAIIWRCSRRSGEEEQDRIGRYLIGGSWSDGSDASPTASPTGPTASPTAGESLV